MSDQIEINYEEIKKVGKQFGQRGDQMQKLVKTLEGQIGNLRSGGWIGVGANAFYAEMDNDVLPAMTRLFQALEEAESTLQRISSAFENAEEEAKSCVDFKID